MKRACAIREPGSRRKLKFLRFYMEIKTEMKRRLNKWVTSQKENCKKNDLENDSKAQKVRGRKEATREALHVNCTPLTRGQRCEDWLVTRRLRVTVTTGADILQRD